MGKLSCFGYGFFGEKNTMDYVKKLIGYIKEKYNVDYECPFVGSPDTMIFRDRLSDKWFALVMPVEKCKLGVKGEGEMFVVNVKADPSFVSLAGTMPGYLPAYHMSKKHWLTMFLDGTVSFSEICAHLDESFDLITNTPTRRIYEAVKLVPRGSVATYGNIAELAGEKKMARAVGNALHKNPDPENVPCYRIVNSKGELAGEFAFGGEGAQAALLAADGIEVVCGKVDLEKYGIRIVDGKIYQN